MRACPDSLLLRSAQHRWPAVNERSRDEHAERRGGRTPRQRDTRTGWTFTVSLVVGHETKKSETRRKEESKVASWHGHGRQAPFLLVVLEAPDATVIIDHSRCCRGSRGLARWPPPRLPCPAPSSVVCPLFFAAATACAPFACWPMPMTVASTTTFCSC